MSSDYDIAIVGGGIASLTAAITGARFGRRVIVLSRDVIGGHLLNLERIDGYPGFPVGIAGYELLPGLNEAAIEQSVEFETRDISSVTIENGAWRLAGDGDSLLAQSVIVATGTSLRPLGVLNESEFAGSGLSSCAACDGPLYSGKRVIVVGGGDSALQEAIKVSDFASHVTLIERADALTGQLFYQDEVSGRSNIEVRCQTKVESIIGNGVVTGVTIRSPRGTEEIEAAGIFPFVGLDPATEFLAGVVERDALKAIVVDSILQTTARGLFAAGTCRAGSAFRAASASGDGAAAAVAAHRYIGSL